MPTPPWHHLDAFLNSRAQAGQSAHTLAAYRRDLQQLQALLAEQNISHTLTRLQLVAVLKTQRPRLPAAQLGTQTQRVAQLFSPFARTRPD